MEAVVEAGLMWPEESGGYRFRSPLVREVAYDTMLRRHRAELHRKWGCTSRRRAPRTLRPAALGEG